MTQALVTGIAGQDGYYLSQELLAHGYAVTGVYRGQDEARLARKEDELHNVRLLRGDVTDAASMHAIMREVRPDVVFNLAALTFVGNSWATPSLYMETNAIGFLNVLEAVREHAKRAHVVQASTSEMYGDSLRDAANERTPFAPASPYGVSKLAAHALCRVYRDSYDMRVSSAISFNHESPRRPETFVTRKITAAAARGERVTLGNLSARRDWGHARDFVRAYRLMAERDCGDDFVIGTGEVHSIGDVCALAYGADWESMVDSGSQFMRPNDVGWLCADASKAATVLGWKPDISFESLIREMVEADTRVTA